jgi:CubicO group peptidase (beta-lactamase class C family)
VPPGEPPGAPRLLRKLGGRLSALAGSTYLGRCLAWNQPTNRDFSRMPQRPIAASPQASPLPAAATARDLFGLQVAARRGEPRVALGQLLGDTGTTALVVLHDGKIVWEHYPNRGSRARPNRCFSVTKSMASALVGIAIAEGAITSADVPIAQWLPGLRDARVGALTIAHLLEMRSGIRFSEGRLPWHDAPKTYYATDLRRRLLECRLDATPGEFFHYNDWHPLLLTLVLERATGMSVSAYLESRLWHPLGCEYPASMMVDRARSDGVEHLESGLTARAVDLAKFGQLYLQHGRWGDRSLVPAAWAEASTSPARGRADAEWFRYYRGKPWGRVFASGQVFYGRMWWGVRIDEHRHDHFAMGVLGQHVYISPDTGTVIVRMSDRFPPGMWWPPVFRQVAEAVAAC